MSSGSEILPGQMKLYADCAPPLSAGDYTVLVKQKVEFSSDEQKLTDVPHYIRIEGPRFSLNPADVHSVFPPANGSGPFESRLPMITLCRRTLPWERRLYLGEGYSKTWMALLLLKEDEILKADEDTVFHTDWTADDVLNPPSNTYLQPNLQRFGSTSSTNIGGVDSDIRQSRCVGIELYERVFQAVCPRLDELKYLTHARQVSTEDKELLGMDKDGWFSVVIGNRLPDSSYSGNYHACLVSLEGWESVLPDDDTPQVSGSLVDFVKQRQRDESSSKKTKKKSTIYKKLRLAVLARWSFKVLVAGDFESYMLGLDVNMFGANPVDSSGLKRRKQHRAALYTGHVPLKYDNRDGESTLAWYRGPFTPLLIERDDRGPYHTADQARRLDPATGLENIGYAAAFEIGRLLALGDPRFALSLLQWRRRAVRRKWREIDLQITRDRLRDRLEELRGKMEFKHLIQLLEDPIEDILRDPGCFLDAIAQTAGGLVENQVMQGDRLFGAAVDATGIQDIKGSMPGFDLATVQEAFGLDANEFEAIFHQESMLEGVTDMSEGGIWQGVGLEDAALEVTDISLGRLQDARVETLVSAQTLAQAELAAKEIGRM